MRKRIYCILIMGIVLTMAACAYQADETKIITPLEPKDLEPVQSLGNQLNQPYSFKDFAKDGDTIYTIDRAPLKEGGTEGRSIAKFSLKNPDARQVIYRGEGLEHISVMGDWIFFTEGSDGDIGGDLYKVKKDGSGKIRISDEIGFYVLTKKEIFYETLDMGLCSIYAMELDGSNERKVLGRGHYLLGIDRGWIYFYVDDGDHGVEEPGPYRIKADSTQKECLLDSDLEILEPFVVENNQLFLLNRMKKALL